MTQLKQIQKQTQKTMYDNENQQNTNSKSYLFGRSYLSYAYTPERSHCDVIEKSLLRTTNGPWIHYSDDNHVNFPKNEAKNVRLLFHDDVAYKKFNDLIAMVTKQNVAFDELIKQMIDK